MPIKIQSDLPACSILENENIFVMTDQRAVCQDIRPLKIAIVNLMPTKIATETQLLRLLGNTPLQVEISLVHMEHHVSKNTGPEHLERFYITSKDVLHSKYDGMIITGAPVEQLPFEQVDYWDDLCAIMDFARENVFSTLYICWGAQAGLYHHYGVQKQLLDAKLFGVYDHYRTSAAEPLLRGFDDIFPVPQSRHTTVSRSDIEAQKDLTILAESREAGVLLVRSPTNREIFMTGHLEYDTDTLAAEYFRDKEKGLPIDVPYRYFPGDDPANPPLSSWRSTAHLFYSNWLNYCVYQETPFDLSSIK
ncbi:homoserine O-acetyltransferase MetA [Treponema brennaborense]|uniref:Homoserine O-acetyltransferase n=1 Tax=Treponema brennaborense (strain DSM 12168 / CIP 105900 / DD5/3) TaxID=906968 RepID=F4LK63_TREBD|nr:homoserine O-succinyltransferase [Treponema brennaborense]AEE17525.1 Homoserine O-succinyltransferase [Treponema brennaborense DSM 12168]